eukprot:scaffold7404_cov363-Prasinococcus_capsulatus_cf.AAC.3
MEFTGIGLLPDDVILRITNTTPYFPSKNSPGGVMQNGMIGEFGNINVLSDTSVGLRFELMNGTDGTPYPLSHFFFTWFDLDTSVNLERQEKVIVDGQESLNVLTPTTTLEVSDEGAGRTGYCATVFGTLADNPTDANNLTMEQEDKAVTLRYDGLSMWETELDVGGPGIAQALHSYSVDRPFIQVHLTSLAACRQYEWKELHFRRLLVSDTVTPTTKSSNAALYCLSISSGRDW